MKVSERNTVAIILMITAMVGQTEEQSPTGVAKAQDWYGKWVKSQENPYIKKRVLELGKKISQQRGFVSDTEPRGWFKQFLLERVLGKIALESRQARKDAEKMESEANSEMEILADDAGGASGITTESAITVGGAGILCFFILACVCAIWFKK